jgi:hypothetical protein
MEGLVRETFEYIQTFSERYKQNPELHELNRIINRLDIEKDSKAGGTMVDDKRPAYKNATNSMFPDINTTDAVGKLGRIEKGISDATVLGPKGKAESFLKRPGKGYTASFMPEHITNAYHDSGYNPKDIKQDFTTWITPGSFIDPAGRDKPNKNGTAKFPEDGESIRISLDSFGFPGIIFTATMRDNNECNVVITIPGVADVNITRDVNFLSIGEGPDYFCGNNIKNKAINLQPPTTNGIAEIKKYIISKELSDFSQILFAIINMIRLRKEQKLYSHCMFTTDNVVAARSRLMGLQSCVQDHSIKEDKSRHYVIMYYAQLDPVVANRELRTTYLKSCLKNNRTVKEHIALAIIEGFFIDGNKYLVEEGEGEIKKYLHEIIDGIDKATFLAEKLPLEGPKALDPDVYRNKMLKYNAKTPINEKGRVIQGLQRLFVECPELKGADAIYRGGDTFGIVINYFIKEREKSERIVRQRGTRGGRRKTRKFLNLRKMRGGAMATDEELPSLFTSETDPWDGSVVPIPTGSLLHHMRLILQANESDFEDFIFRAFNHLIYIRETPLDQRLLYIYKNIDTIENSTLDSFNYEYYNNYATNPDVLALADLARVGLVAARAVDPMEMLAYTPLPSEVDVEMAPESEVYAEEVTTDDEGEMDVKPGDTRESVAKQQAHTAQKAQGSPSRGILRGPKGSKKSPVTQRSFLYQRPISKGVQARKTRKQRKSRRNTTWKRN